MSKTQRKRKGGIKGYLERLPPIQFKRLAIKLLPYIGIFYVGDKLAWLYRYCVGQTAFSRLFVLLPCRFSCRHPHRLRRSLPPNP